MADLCCEYNLAVGSGRKLNDAAASSLITTGIDGLDGRPIRATIRPRGATNGGRKLTSRFGPRIIVFSGDIHVRDAAGVLIDPTKGGAVLTDYLTRLNVLVSGWVTDLEAKLNTAFNLTYTPTGMSLVTKSVTYGFEGGEFKQGGTTWEPTFTFGLVAETD